MPTWTRRVKIAMDWTVALLFPRDLAQLGSLGEAAEPFERVRRSAPRLTADVDHVEEVVLGSSSVTKSSPGSGSSSTASRRARAGVRSPVRSDVYRSRCSRFFPIRGSGTFWSDTCTPASPIAEDHPVRLRCRAARSRGRPARTPSSRKSLQSITTEPTRRAPRPRGRHGYAPRLRWSSLAAWSAACDPAMSGISCPPDSSSAAHRVMSRSRRSPRPRRRRPRAGAGCSATPSAPSPPRARSST